MISLKDYNLIETGNYDGLIVLNDEYNPLLVFVCDTENNDRVLVFDGVKWIYEGRWQLVFENLVLMKIEKLDKEKQEAAEEEKLKLEKERTRIRNILESY